VIAHLRPPGAVLALLPTTLAISSEDIPFPVGDDPSIAPVNHILPFAIDIRIVKIAVMNKVAVAAVEAVVIEAPAGVGGAVGV
jgi:hypothetical protein